MREKTESPISWFTVGVAVSLSAATFASPIGTTMDQPWRHDKQGNVVPLDRRAGPDTYFSVSRQPWSGAWWATKSGSVALRWHTAMIPVGDTRRWPTLAESQTQTYATYSGEELATMSETELLENLSPIEKVDVVAWQKNGRYGQYPNLQLVRNYIKTANQSQLTFHGLCHGYAHAAIWLPEPDYTKIPAKVRRADGSIVTISVPFGSGDLKAIGTWVYGDEVGGIDEPIKDAAGNYVYSDGKLMTKFVPSKYEAGMIDDDRDGEAMNPAALHLLLLNLVKTDDQSFVVDLATGPEIWNYPVVGYDMTSTAQESFYDRSTGAVKVVYYTTRVDFQRTTNPADESFGPFADVNVPGSARNDAWAGNQFKQKYYKYRLELTADDEIVGGSWMIGGNSPPDYAWAMKSRIPFRGDFSFLEKYWPSAR